MNIALNKKNNKKIWPFKNIVLTLHRLLTWYYITLKQVQIGDTSWEHNI
jgi:hypothetical protein